MVHDNTQFPLVDRLGYQLVPGRKHRLGYSKLTYNFLPSPYTTCSDTVSTEMQAVFDQFSDASYSYGHEICFKIAIQIYV